MMISDKYEQSSSLSIGDMFGTTDFIGILILVDWAGDIETYSVKNILDWPWKNGGGSPVIEVDV